MSKKGENIFKRKDGRWEARYIHHYENGKAVYRYIYGKTYREAKAKRQSELLRPNHSDKFQSKNGYTFEFLAGLWLSDVKLSVRESTYTRYYRIVTHYLFPVLRDQSLCRMDKKYFNQLAELLLSKGGMHQQPLSPKTVSDILCVLKSICKYGKLNDYPCPDLRGLKYPQKSSRNIKILTDENRKTLEKQLWNSQDTTSLGIIFTLFTGVRIGELCGIRWEDIDFVNSTVNICRTVERIADLDPSTPAKTKVILSEPKTDSSVRLIPLPDFLMEYLKSRKKSNDCYLITGTRSYTEPHQYYVRYKKCLEENHIDNYTFHALRHTFATRCIELDFDTKSLSEILGHSSITTTLSFYVHPTLQQKKAQMNRLVPACC